MVQNKNNIIKFKPKKPKPMKYWLCEFFKRYGEDENTYHYIFSDKNILSVFSKVEPMEIMGAFRYFTFS